ncbi:MAG TPA: tRNA adenosine(34) deaminase TadA [Polyangiaceae bacterium]|jgi:tRNA(adenine34) deaminase
MDDEGWMREALAQAAAAAVRGEVPVGCVIVRNDAVIGRGHNLRESDRDPTAHAEMIAIREAARAIGDHRLNGVTAYVTLEPCAMCAGALVHARVDRVVYGAADPKAGAVHTLFSIGRDKRLNHVFDVTAGVLADESASMLRAFFEALRAQGKK